MTRLTERLPSRVEKKGKGGTILKNDRGEKVIRNVPLEQPQTDLCN